MVVFRERGCRELSSCMFSQASASRADAKAEGTRASTARIQAPEGRDHALFIIWHQSLEQRLARRHGRHAGLSGRESYLYHPASWASSGMFLKASLL